MRTPHTPTARFVRTLLCGLCLAFTISSSWAQSSDFSYGFEIAPSANDWTADIQVPSGTDGITAASGSSYGKLVASDFTRFGGFNSVFPCNGYVASIKIYLDVSAGYANDTRFDYSVASNGTDGNHRRDFIFSVGFYDDGVAPGAGNRFIIGASNNSNDAPDYPRLAASNPVATSTSGWYTFEHSFADNAGVLEVTMKVYDPSNSLVNTWTLSTATDMIPSVVGGNRYGWFPVNNFSALPIDDVTLTPNPGNLPTAFTDFETFNTGSVNYQGPGCTTVTSPNGYTVPNPYGSLWTVTDEWGTAPSSFDQEVVDDGTGNMVWRVSNAVTTSGYSNLPNSPSSLQVAGESTAALYNDRGDDHTMPLSPPNPRESASTPYFHSGFRFKSSTGAAQPGLFMSVNPTPRQSSIRMGYVGIEDVGTGFDLNFIETTPGAQFSSSIIATNLSYADWHQLDIYVEFVDGLGSGGAGNDIVIVELDGNVIHVGTTWESFYAETPGSFPNAPYAVDALLFRLSGTAAAGTSGNGFFVDDVTYDNVLPPPGPVKLYDDNTLGTLISTHFTIQGAIDAAVAGNAIVADAGTYNEPVIINKSITISGAGKGNDPSTNTILSATAACAGTGITVGADNVHVSGVRVEGFNVGMQVNNTDGTQLTDVALVDYCNRGLALGGFNENVTLLTTDIIIVAAPLTSQVGIRLGTADGVDGLTFDGGSIKGNNQGVFVAQSSSAPAIFNDITFENAEISNNAIKGIYVEKLSNALFDNLVMDSNGTDPGYGNNAGLDINLKYGNYSNIVISNSAFTANGATGTATDPENPSAIAIKARDDGGTYGPNPATLDNVSISNCIVYSPNNGIRFGEPGQINASPTNVFITNCDLSTFGNKAIINRTQGVVTMDCNWHGSDDPVIIATGIAGPGEVTFEPFLITGGDSGSAAPGFSPTGDCVGCAGGLATVTNTNSGESFCSIQAAIDDADAGDIIIVGAGTYEEQINVYKEVDLRGPNYGVSPNSPGRNPEAIIVPPANLIDLAAANPEQTFAYLVAFYNDANGIKMDGFTINGDNPNISGFVYAGMNIEATVGVYSQGLDNIGFTNNIVENFTYMGFWAANPFGNSSQNLTLSDNKINNVHDLNALGFGFASYIQATDGLISNNVVTNARNGIQVQPYTATGMGVVSNNSFDIYNLGIWYNYAENNGSGSWTIENNSILGVNPPSATGGALTWTGIAVQTMRPGAGPATFEGNSIDGGVVSSASPNWSDVIGYRVRTPNENAADINTFTNNSITNVETFINNQTTQEVNANCNWYGSAIFADITSGITGPVDFIPYLNNGTDDDAGTAGFQPVAGSCTGGPVRVYEDAALTVLVSLHATIQAAIDDAATLPGYFVLAEAGTYEEDVNINKSITVQGAGMDVTTVIGPIGGNGATFRVSAPGVTIDGFTITRAGNNTTDWNDAGLNFAGIAIQGQANDAEIRNCKITGNRTGIDVNNSNDNNIHNNVITSNRTGLLFRNQTDNTILVENEITDSWTMGILFLDASGGSNSPVQSAVNSTFNDNNISGNWYGQIVDRQAGGALPAPGTTNLKNFECNWFGTTSPVVSTMDSSEPGYGDIPVAYGGTATDPGGQPDILGPGSANFEYILYLINGTDDEPGTPGFQPAPLACIGGCPGGLAVINSNTGESFCSIQEAINDTDTQNGHTIEVIAGTYDENVIINKSINLIGPNADTGCGSRVAEAIVSPAGGVPFTVTVDDVTINGFEITAPSSTYGVNFGNTSNVSIKFNNLHDIGTSVTNSNVHAIIYTVASGAATSGVSITDNCFDNISSTLLSGYSASAIGILQSPSTGVLDGLNIERNTINDVEVNTGDWPTGKIAYGILINVGGGGGYLATAGEVQNAVISNNEISNLSGFISTGIGLEGNTKDAIVENNTVFGLYGRKVGGTRNNGGFDLSALKIENNRWVGTLTVENNSFQVSTFTHDVTPGLGYAVSNYVPVGTAFVGGGITGELTISCNWLGTQVNSEIIDNASFSGTIFNKDNSVTNFVPFLVNDTDDEPGTVGFQPAPLSCVGGPVTVYDGTTFIAAYTEIQAAIDDATTLSGHTVRIATGTYVENVDAVSGGKDLIFSPGASPGCVTINGDFTLNAGDALEIEIEGTTACTEHDQFIVTGMVDLGRADIITPLGMYLAADGDEIVIIDGSSAVNATFSQGNFVTDGTNNYYIDYAAGVDGFDVVLTKCCVGLLDLGIANYAATSPVGNKLQVFVQPNQDIVNGDYSAGVFTIRTLSSNGVTFTKLGGALSPFDYNQAGSFTDGGYTYYLFSYESVNMVDWVAGTEYLLLTLSYDCIGDAEFELTNDAFTLANNGGYYQELGAAEAQGIFYQPTVTSPTAVSITADNSGTVCDGVDVDLSSVTVDGTAPYTYAWSGPGMYMSTDADPAPFASTLASNGIYTVTVTDANGCTATATTEVVVLDNAACVHNVTQNNYYPTITQAIDATATVDDDVLFVPAADWPENVVVTKALTINGANAGTSCDDGARGAESVILGTTVVIIASDGVTLDGFTLEGITGVSSAGFKDVGLVNNKINAKQFGINSSQITTSAGEGYIMQDNCINFCSQVFDAEGFATNPTLASAQTAGEWYTDRYAPAGFVAEVFEGDSRLKHSIDAADCASCRGGGQTGAFYNTQGRKYDITGALAMSIELYVPSSWATTGRRMAGFWGTALDAGSSISGYPIIEFTSENGTPRFRGWDSDGSWVDLGLPTGFAYDQWYTLEIALLPNDEFMYSVGDISASVPALGSTIIDNVILQGHNTDTPGVTYDIYWDNFNTFCAPVELNSQTIGINLASADGTEAVVLQDNNVSNSFYAYVLGGVTTTSRTTVQGGELTDIMQGVVVANIVNGVSFLPSSVGVADLSMTSFSGDYPALPAFNFHSGVYAFTGGTDAAATVDLMIDNITVSNTGKPQQDAAGISFSDFSSGADPRLTATVTNSVISNNLNRGVNVRGQNASIIISDSDILSNGADPFGAGGNNGFGIYAGVGSQIELYNNNIVNPASQTGAFPVTAIFNGVAPASTIIANNNFIDDNGNGDVTRNPYAISFFDATCNWWGSSDVDVIDALVEGNVFFLPYLDDGTDDQPATVGFQTSANCINPTDWYVNDDAQTDDVFTLGIGDDTNPGTKRRPFRTIGQAVAAVENTTTPPGADDNTIFVDAGSYDEQVVVPNTVNGLTLQGVGPCDAVAPALRTTVNFTGTVTGKPTLFDIAGNGAIVDGIQFEVDLTKLHSAIIASDAGLDDISLLNNCIDPYQSIPGTNLGGYGNRNAISINYGGPTNFRVASGGVDNIVADNNRVTATVNGTGLGDDAGDIGFRSAVSVDEGAGTYTRNIFQTINHDILVRFNSNGDVIIGGSPADANTFNGGGVQYADPNAAGGTVTISHNTFDGSVSNSVLRLQNNYHNAAVAVSDNIFTNLRWGASLENFSNVTVADNIFSPLAGFSNFRLITVNTKSISGNSAAIVQVPIDGVFTGNTFNAGAAGTGTALAFYNHDSDNATLGSFTVGTSGSPNIFAPGFLYAVYLGDQLGSTLAATATFPEYNLGAGSDTEMACWDRDIDVQNNSFDVGSGAQFPSTMNNAERLALEDILYHLPDNACLGELIYFDPVLVDAKVFLQGPYDSVSGLMNDDLRAGGLVPLSEPFSSINTDHPGSFVEVNNFVTETIAASVLDVTGDNAIVDWVWLELRDMADFNTVVATRSALVQRDGDIVDLDGNASVEFPDSYVGEYYLLVRHRNHLGAMTASPVDFTAVMPVDFTVAAEPTFGATTTSARRLVKTGIYGLWAGNTLPYPSAGFNVKYNGSDNDRLVILNAVGNMTPLNILSNTYQLEDVNMDGRVKYNGSQNDRVIILQNVGPSNPLNVITQEPNN